MSQMSPTLAGGGGEPNCRNDAVTLNASPAENAAAPSPPAPQDLALDAWDIGLPRVPEALLERFESFRLVGRGGMGVVFRAKDKALGREVAVKLLIGADAELQSRLLREARSQARITHENVCKVYEVGLAEGQGYLIMQDIDGRPFDEGRERMTLEEKKARVVQQVAFALHEAHRMGLVHRDVKPSNSNT